MNPSELYDPKAQPSPGPYFSMMQRIEAKLDQLLELAGRPVLSVDMSKLKAMNGDDQERRQGKVWTLEPDDAQATDEAPWIERKDWGTEYPTGKVDLQFRDSSILYDADAANVRWTWLHNHPNNVTAYRPAKEQA